MVNILKIQEENIKKLLEENENLKKQLAEKEQTSQFKQLNNEEIREWVITKVLRGTFSASEIDHKIIDNIIMRVYCYQENWLAFCKRYPTEEARKAYILTAYKFNKYYNKTNELYGVRNNAKTNIFINLIKLNSEESKELFRKWISEGKLENCSTVQRVLEKGYESDSISQTCYSYVDIRHLSLDELISSWNELTVKTKENFDKVAKQNQENEEKIKALEVEQENLEAEVEQLEERVKIEQEQVKEIIAVGEKWSKNQAEDIKEKNKKLKSNSEKISYLESQVEKLEEESSQKNKKIEKLSKQLSDSESQNESLKSLNYLNSKPLPALPVEEENKSFLTKQSMFKQLKIKAKIKIQKLQKLIKKEKLHNQEMIAQVEASSK